MKILSLAVVASFLLTFHSQAMGQSMTYFQGERIEKSNKGDVDKKSIIGQISSHKGATVWSIIRCNLPQNDHCVSYEFALREKMNGGWVFELPGANGMIKAPLETSDNLSPPKMFSSRWNDLDGKQCCTFLQRIDGGKTYWYQERLEGKEKIQTISTLTPTDKATFDKLSATRKAKPL